MCDVMGNTKRNVLSRKQLEKMVHNANKVTLLSEKICYHEQLTYPATHLQY